MTPLALAAVDAGPLRETLAARGRLHVPGFLTPGSAETIGAALAAERGWYRSVKLASGGFSAPLDGEEPIETAHRAWLDEARFDGASPVMQYIYDSRRLSTERRHGLTRGDLLEEL